MLTEDNLKRRVRERLDALGKKPMPAALDVGLARDFIIDILNDKKKSVRGDKLQQLANALECEPEWLLSGKTSSRSAAPPRRMVPIVGYVGAGAQAHLYSEGQGPFGEVEDDEAGPSTVAVEIRGGSLGALFDTWLVFYDDVRSPITSDLVGRLCVVGLPDGRILVKKIQRRRGESTYNLLSATEEPIYDVEIDWAARVNKMTPR